MSLRRSPRHSRLTPPRAARARWARWTWCLPAVLLLVVLAACAPEEEDELTGPFGPGSGGQAVNTGSLVTLPFNKPGGGALGSLASDTSYFPQVPAPGAVITLPSIVDPTVLVVTWISGRPETPCRYAAAIDGRDNGYEILGSGDRTNDKNLIFHQVDLVKGASYRSYYCTTIRDNVGIMILGESPNGNRLGYLQVHYVLNSISP